MTHHMLSRVVAFALAFAALMGAAQAHSVSGNFLDKNLSPSASGGIVAFVLNVNGTIGASMISLDGGIWGFAFDSVAFNLPEYGFPPGQPDNTAGWGGAYGQFRSGFMANSPYPTSMTWTIGNPGDYTSVSQVLGGPIANWDFYMRTDRGNEWAAVASVPEPETYVLMSLGLALLLGVGRRARQV